MTKPFDPKTHFCFQDNQFIRHRKLSIFSRRVVKKKHWITNGMNLKMSLLGESDVDISTFFFASRDEWRMKQLSIRPTKQVFFEITWKVIPITRTSSREKITHELLSDLEQEESNEIISIFDKNERDHYPGEQFVNRQPFFNSLSINPSFQLLCQK